MKRNRGYYDDLFRNYDDVVTLSILRKMLGGVSETYLRPLLQKRVIKNFKIQDKIYMIPKEYVIDYLLSEHYRQHKDTLKAQV